ncbi:MAG: hypothetical protein AAF642_18380 [Pseudomonadota bacterium]
MIGLGLVHAACAVIMLIFAIGIYNQKPDIQKYESALAGLPILLQSGLSIFLIIILAGNLQLVTGLLAFPSWLIDAFGLIIHEGGHFFTSWAGELIHFFGGTLFEIGVPAGLTLWFLCRNCKRLGALTLGWMSVALFSVASYSGDAQKLELSLLGSPSMEQKLMGHDWYNILRILDLLEATPIISDTFWSMAMVAGLSAIAVSVWAIYGDHRAKAVFDQKLS